MRPQDGDQPEDPEAPLLPHEGEESAPVGSLGRRPRRPARTWRGVEVWLGFVAVMALATSCCCGAYAYSGEAVIGVSVMLIACGLYWRSPRATARGKVIAASIAIVVAALGIAWTFRHGGP